jgi:hypothetical protein
VIAWFKRNLGALPPQPHEVRLLAAHTEHIERRKAEVYRKQRGCPHACTDEDVFDGAVVCLDCGLRVKA